MSVDERMMKSAFTKACRIAELRRDRLVQLQDSDYLLRPRTGRGTYYLWRDGLEWYWKEVNEQTIFGPLPKQRDVVSAIMKYDNDLQTNAVEMYIEKMKGKVRSE